MQGINFSELPPFLRAAIEQAGILNGGVTVGEIKVGSRRGGKTIGDLLGNFVQQMCPACQALDMFGEMIAEHSAKVFADKVKKAGQEYDQEYDQELVDQLKDEFESPMSDVQQYWHSRISELHFNRASSLQLMEEFLYPLLDMANTVADRLFVQYVALQDADGGEEEQEGEEDEPEDDEEELDEEEESDEESDEESEE